MSITKTAIPEKSAEPNPTAQTAATADGAPPQKTLFGMTGDIPLKIPLIGLCGKKGSGKTLAGLTIDPRETTVIDIEDSSVSYNLPLKHRYSLYDEVKTKNADGIPSPIECWEWFMGILGQIDSRVLFVDPINDLQQGLVDWVRAHPEKFGKTDEQYRRASGLLWADVKSYLKIVLGRMSRRVECFVFATHTGSVWSGGAPVAGKIKAKGVDTFYELASLYLYLSRDADPKDGLVPAKPIASISPPLGKSRLAHINVGQDGTVEAIPILPPRMKDFSWDLVRRYVANPPNYGKLKADQRADSMELTEDEKLQIGLEKANLERETEALRNDRLAAISAAAARNKKAASSTASSATSSVAKATKVATPLVAADVPENPAASDVVPDPGLMTDGQVVEEIRQSFVQLKLQKTEVVKEIWSYQSGAKLAELTPENMRKLLNGLRAKLLLVESFEKK